MFSQGQFLIDPNTPPEEIIRKRAALNKVMRAYGRANNLGEGVGDLMMGLGEGIQDYRVGKAERAQAEGANSAADLEIAKAYGAPAAPQDSGLSGMGQPSAPIDMTGNEVFSGFMDTVKSGGVTNPYALAAIAATGKRESGFSPSNVNRTWSDPSESGQAGTAGGIMSWRGPRYQALAATGDLSPQGQAKFFLQEDPQLIARLNAAQSAEEAQQMMNEAWKFAGYNRPGGEAAARLAAANSFLPTFQQGATQPQPIMDPAAYNASVMRQSPDLGGEPMPVDRAPLPMRQPTPQGQPPIAGIQPTAPTMQNMDRMMVPSGMQPIAQGRDALAQALMQQQTGAAAPQAIEQIMAQAPSPQSANAGMVNSQRSDNPDPSIVDPRAQFNSPQLNAADPRRGILQAIMGQQGGQPAQANPAAAKVQQAMQGQSQGTNLDMNKVIELMNNPFLDPGKKAVLGAMLERQMQAQDPVRQMQLEKGRLEIEQMRNPTPKPTAGIQEYEYAKAQGFEGSYTDFQTALKKAGATNVSVGDGAPGLGKLSTDYGYKLGPDGKPIIGPDGLPIAAPIPGSPAAADEKKIADTSANRNSAALTASDIVTSAAGRARKAAAQQDFGPSGTSVIGQLPWTDSAEVLRQTKVLQSVATIENLNSMRQQSPTGGALGNVTEKEGKMLAAKSGALDPNSPNFLRDLDDYERTLLRVIHGKDEGDRLFKMTRPAKLISEMTDEELEALANGN